MNVEPDRCRRDTSSLEPFFSPRSIAIVGLSRTALEGSNSVFNTLKNFGFSGGIHIVNPNIPASLAENVHASISDLPEQVDVAIVVVARHLVVQVLEECVKKQIKAAIVITQGFADADAEGARLQDLIVRLTRENDIRVLGPNTIGMSNAFSNFTSSFIEMHNARIPVGQISQTGLFMMGHNIVGDEPAGFGMAVDIGNASDVGLIDILEYYGQEDKIKVIQCHVEGIEDGAAFLEASARIGKEKPIIIYKSGVSEAGRVAVASHSGAAAGEAQVYQAAFRKAGLIQADSAEELRLLTKAFATYRPPTGNRVAIVSFSGGGAIMAIDALEGAGLQKAELSEQTIERLKPFYPEWMEVGNPLDIWMTVAKDFHRIYPVVLESVLLDTGVDSVICIYPSFSLPKYDEYDSSRHIPSLARKYPEKPVLCWTYGVNVAGFSEIIERDGSCMVFPSLSGAAGTLAKMIEYGRTRSSTIATPEPITQRRTAVQAVLKIAHAAGKGYLFHEGFEILEAYGAETAAWKTVTQKGELEAAGTQVGFPLCMKVISDDVIHKSDSGGVRLNIRGTAELTAAYEKMVTDIAKANPGAIIEGVLLQAMVSKGKEIMIGVKSDPVFGHCLVLGAGGVYAEILNDFAFRLAPINRADAYGMIDELACAPILKGVRGEASCDIDGIVDVLLSISNLVCAHPEIKELDVNPIMVTEEKAVIVDVRIII